MVGNEDVTSNRFTSQRTASSGLDQTEKISQHYSTEVDLNTAEVIVKFEKKEYSASCRVCLQEGDIPIHGDDRFSDVSQELNAFAGINVRHDDEFPKHLCENCNSQLQGAIQLRTTAQYSEIILQQRIERHDDTENCEDVSFQEADSNISGCDSFPEAYDNKCDIKNIFNIRVVRDTIQKSYTSCLEIKPLVHGDKSVSQQRNLIRSSHIAPQIVKKEHTIITFDKLECKRKPNINNSNETATKSVIITNKSAKKPKTCNRSRPQKNPKIVISKSCIETSDKLNQITKRIRSKKTPAEKLYCRRCKITFDTDIEYGKHKKSDEHKNHKEVCPICHKLYNWGSLKLHQGVHNRVINHICDICGKGFGLKQGLSNHLMTHSFNLPFQCSQCPYKCRTNASLRLHIRTHTGEKPFQCAVCAERFTTTSNLKRHMFTNHKSGHDFTCDMCNRGFYRKIELERHIRANHMGIKDHVCDLCDKAFGTRSLMMKHKAKVHKRKKLLTGRTPLYLLAEQQGISANTDTT